MNRSDAAEHERFLRLGFNAARIVNVHLDAALAQFFVIGDPDGDRIEILQRAGRYL